MEVQTFRTAAEIAALEGFKPDNPVNKDNYSSIRGDYHLEPESIRCCFLKPNGKPCAEEHSWGFVAVLVDGSLTVVGNQCARDKLSVDNAKVTADLNKYLNEKRRQDALARLAALLESKESILADIHQVKVGTAELQGRMRSFKSDLGAKTSSRLTDMARTGNSSVMVKAVSIKKYNDANGQPKQERTEANARIGAIVETRLLLPSTFQSVLDGIAAVEQALKDAEDLAPEDQKSHKLDSLSGRIENSKRALNQLEDLLIAEATFLKNDFSLFCFLVSDAERYVSAKLAMRQLGIPGGKDAAKSWLLAKENEYKRTLGADRIEIV